VQDRIGQAALRAGRRPEAVRLIAATKSVPPERIRVAVEAGTHHLGENRLQEALPKMEALRGYQGIAWHFIGRLQRRKVKEVVGRFQMIHSVDSLDLAGEIDRRAAQAGIRQAVLLEVNVGGEASKAGFAPSALRESLEALEGLPNLEIQGLMTVPPLSTDPESARPYFRELRELAGALGRPGLRELSMGMSQDFEIAVEEGATMVRVGTAIFGARPRHG
jgi:pyridoxal phosphate enzyme (YggS family)